jgi:hypothetical protein
VKIKKSFRARAPDRGPCFNIKYVRIVTLVFF